MIIIIFIILIIARITCRVPLVCPVNRHHHCYSCCVGFSPPPRCRGSFSAQRDAVPAGLLAGLVRHSAAEAGHGSPEVSCYCTSIHDMNDGLG